MIRSLVREALNRAETQPPLRTNASEPEHLIVNSLKEKARKEFDRDESSKTLLTELDLRGLEPGARVRVSPGTKFTPLANDIIRENNIELIEREARTSSVTVRSVAIGADHGGFQYKEALKAFLADLGVSVRDFGTDSTEAVDYPDFASEVAKCVSAGHVECGILIDGAGIGSAMAANKVPGVRAAACYSTALAANSREHNGANILTLGSGQVSLEEAKKIVESFLSTRISEERHKRRVAKIDDIDRQYRR
ncbi:MAG: ribose 5-phosphate isomerase B [Acidobacteria bacterium]|nr:ribose 5-phosphate isomerase B [Acidobacteriota bacterium]